jgi:regulator of protease activity HflC (stomatin/prohibitin superfamily)
MAKNGKVIDVPIRKPPGGFPRSLVIVVIVLIFLSFVYATCLTYVHPNEFGIKQVRIAVFAEKGIINKVYEPGLTFLMPFGIWQMLKLPKDLQVLELTNSRDTAAHSQYATAYDNAAHIQTSDGFYVDVDCSVLYRIIDPYKVITTIGPGRLFVDNGILPKAEPNLKDAFGKLTTEEFYNSPMRVKAAEQAKTLMNDELESKGIKIEQVLVRYFRYSEEIQRNIEEKKLKDQLVFKNQAEARAAKESANLKRVIEEGLANVQVKLEEGKAYVTTKNAERDLYVRKRNAEADLLVKLAEAKRTQMKNDALTGVGSDKMVGLKMAEAFRNIEIIMLPSNGKDGINPLDLNADLKMFQVKND